MSVKSRTVQIRRVGSAVRSDSDVVTVEEPLEIRVAHTSNGTQEVDSLSVTMRTPGDDEDLACGFLLSEGIVADLSDISCVQSEAPQENSSESANVVTATLASSVFFDSESLLRHFYTSSSCGVCGKVSLAAVDVHIRQRERSKFRIASSTLVALPESLREHQSEFRKTGGLHASALFDAEGRIVRVREDVGRHNALDKLIGSFRNSSLDQIASLGLLLSGRASFELIQKAAIAGLAFVASIGPPSSLAIDLAQDQDITLVGFLRNNEYNQYHGDRVIHD